MVSKSALHRNLTAKCTYVLKHLISRYFFYAYTSKLMSDFYRIRQMFPVCKSVLSCQNNWYASALWLTGISCDSAETDVGEWNVS